MSLDEYLGKRVLYSLKDQENVHEATIIDVSPNEHWVKLQIMTPSGKTLCMWENARDVVVKDILDTQPIVVADHGKVLIVRLENVLATS